MANWIVTSGTLSTTGSTNINNQTIDLVIKPELANGEWSGAFIKKENFKSFIILPHSKIEIISAVGGG